MTFPLKSSHKPVKDYYAALETYRELGYEHEGAVRSAFAELLRAVGKKFHYTLVEEYKVQRNGANLFVDGALIDDFKLAHGYWEAKDSQDDLDREIEIKFKKGYPRTNIIFQEPARAVVIQNGATAFDASLDEPENLIETLSVFFSYRMPQYEEWGRAVSEFSDRVPRIAEGLLELIKRERSENRQFIEAYNGFTLLCKRAINPNLSDAAIEEMLIQHLLTVRIFSMIFNNPDFVQKNIIAAEIEKVINALTSHYFNKHEFLKPLDPFYAAIEATASTVDDYTQKQGFLNTVYEQFFQGFSVKVADTHGIVYTPQPVVNFIVNSVEEILQREFGRSLSDRNVHILDPFVGTGNFIIHVMRKIRKTELPYKYAHELHCNEVMLLPYYIASMNIEHEYYTMTGDYRPFGGICLVDTFELAEEHHHDMGLFTEENAERVRHQKEAPIFVILGNPPYNAGQVNENDNNKNRKYPVIDKRVKETYGKDSKAQLVRKLNDPYVKAIRWASDRIGKEGIVVFVTNNSFIDDITCDGMRKNLANDFDTIYHIDLGGNVRKNPKLSGTTHNVFGIQVGVGISLFVKKSKSTSTCARILYHRVDEYWRKEQKNDFLDEYAQCNAVEYEEIAPNSDYTWLTEGLRDDFSTFMPLGCKKRTRGIETVVFKLFSLGVATNRDSTAYNFDKRALINNISFFIKEYNKAILLLPIKIEGNIDDILSYDLIKWSSTLKDKLKRRKIAKYEEWNVRRSLYRPFTQQYLYYDPVLIDRPARFSSISPTPVTEQENRVICIKGIGMSQPFYTLMISFIPELQFSPNGQCFPFYTYDEDVTTRRENITDWALERFREHYRDRGITKRDIFHYVYGLLHAPGYRERYAANLRRDLPHIPFADAFRAFAEAGRKLADLHLRYEDAVEYPLTEIEIPGERLDWRVEKMRLSRDRRSIMYNKFLTLSDIPAEVYEYRLGNRSALEWIVDQYRVKTDSRSGIVNNPNREDDLQYIVRLIKQIVTVSIVRGLPELTP